MGNENSRLNQDVNFHPADNEVQNKVHNEVQNLPSHKILIRKVNDELDDDITVTYYEDHENNSNKLNDKRIVLVINEKETSKNIYTSTTDMDSSGSYIKKEESKDSGFVNKIKNGCNFDGNFEGDVKTSANFPGELISHNQGSVILPEFDEGINLAGTDEERTDVCTQDDEWFVVDLHHNSNNVNLGMSNGKKPQTQDVNIQALAEEDFHKNQEAFKRDETIEKEHGIKDKYLKENLTIDLQYMERYENKELQERKEEYHLDLHTENERNLDVVEDQNKKAERINEHSEKLDSHDHLKTKSAKVFGSSEEIVDKEYGILHEKPKDNQMEYKEYLQHLDDNMKNKQESNTNDDTDRKCQTKDEESIVEEIGHDTKTENDKNRKTETKVSLAEDIVVKIETKLNKVPCLNTGLENPRDVQGYSEVEADLKKGEKYVFFFEKRNYTETEDNVNIEEDYIQETIEERNNTKGEECADAENKVTLPEGYNMRNDELEHFSKHEKQKKSLLKYKKGVRCLDDNKEDKQKSNTNEDIEEECQTKDEKREVEEIYYAETENNQNRKIKNEISVVKVVAVKRESQLEEVPRLISESGNPIDAKGHSDAETNRKEKEEHIFCYEKNIYHREREDNTNIIADSIQKPNKEKHNIKEEKNADAENEMSAREDHNISDHKVEHCSGHEKLLDLHIECKEPARHVYNNTVDKQESNTHEDIEKEHQTKDKRNKIEEIQHHTETENNSNMIINKEVSEKVAVKMENPLEEDLYLSIELGNDIDLKNHSEVETNNKKEEEYLLCYEKRYDKQTKGNANNEADSIQGTNELKVNIKEEGHVNIEAKLKLTPEHCLISSEVKHCVEHEKQTDFQMEYKESVHHVGDNREGKIRIQEDNNVCDNEAENCSGNENQTGFQIECETEDWHHEDVNTNKKQVSKINENNKKESRKEVLCNKDVESENNISLYEYGRAEIEDHNVDDNMDEKQKSNTNEDTKVECQTKDKKSEVMEIGYYVETKNNDNTSIEKGTSLTEEVALKIDNPLQEYPSLDTDLENDIDVKISSDVEVNHREGKKSINEIYDGETFEADCMQEANGLKIDMKLDEDVNLETELKLREEHNLSSDKVKHCAEHEKQKDFQIESKENCSGDENQIGFQMKCKKKDSHHEGVNMKEQQESKTSKNAEKQSHKEIIYNKNVEIKNEISLDEYVTIEIEDRVEEESCMDTKLDDPQIGEQNCLYSKKDYEEYHNKKCKRETEHNQETNEEQYSIKEGGHVVEKTEMSLREDYKMRASVVEHHIEEEEQMEQMKLGIEKAKKTHVEVECSVEENKDMVVEAGLYNQSENHGHIEVERKTEKVKGKEQEKQVNVELNKQIINKSSGNVKINLIEEVKINEYTKIEILQEKKKLNIEKEHKSKYIECIHAETGTKSPNDIDMEEENNRENVKLGQNIERKDKVHCKEDNQTEEDSHEDIKLDHESDGHLPAQKKHYTKAEKHEDVVLENNRRNEHHTDVKTGFKVKHGDLVEIESQKKDKNYIEIIANHCSKDRRHAHVEKQHHLEDKNLEDNEKGARIELEKHKDMAVEYGIEEEHVNNKSEKHTKYQHNVDAKINISLEVGKQEDAAVKQSHDSEKQYLERKHEIKNDECTLNNEKYQLRNEKHLTSEKEHLTKDQTLHGNSFNHSNTGKSMLVEKCFKNGTLSFSLDHEAEEKHISSSNYLKQVQQHGEDLEVFDVTPLCLEPVFSYKVEETEGVCVRSNLDLPIEKANEPMLQAEKYQEELWVNSDKIKIFQPEILDQINPTVSHAVSNNKSTEEYITVAEETTASEVTMIHQPQTEKRKGELKIIIESESTTDGDDEVFIQPTFPRRNLSSINKVSNDDLNMFEGSFNDLTILEELKLMESNLELDLNAEEIAARETLFMSQENIKISSEPESPALLQSEGSFVLSQKINEKTLLDESKSKNPQGTPKARQKSKTGRKSPKIRKSPKHQKKLSSDSSLDKSNLSDEDDIRKDENIPPENKQRPRRKISSFRRGRNKHPSNTLHLRFCSCGPLVLCGKAED